jgi:hypothetical protein
MRSNSGTSEVRSDARVFGVAFEDRVDFGVGHARGGADDAFDDFEALDAAGGVELHDATEDEAVFVGRRLQMSVESSCGSMGMARSGK